MTTTPEVDEEKACMCPLCDNPIMIDDLYRVVEAHSMIYVVHQGCLEAAEND
jgi:hypothetical protein